MEDFEIKRLITTFFNKKIYIILALLVSLTVGYFYTYYYLTPMYKASTTMLLVKGETETSDDTSTITQSDIALNQKLVSTYTQIIKSNKVLRKTISNLNLSLNENELYNNITVTSADNTEIIKLSVVHSNPDLASKIANEIATIFSTEVKELYNIDNVNVIDIAETPTAPYNINHTKDLLIFSIAGISIACGIIFIYYIFNKTIKLEEDVEEYTGLNVLTTIPVYGKNIKITTKTDKTEDLNTYKELVAFEDSKSPIAECFRTLRTNLQFTQTEKLIKTILVTSGYMKEGKSWTSANMAIAFAKANKKVLLIDTDMRKGRQHHIFKIKNDIGLSNCITITDSNEDIKAENLSKYIKESKIPNIHLMTSGNRPPNPSELISSKKMEELLNLVKEMYDIVILDGSPSMVVSDSIILSKLVDTTVIVTANRETKIETLQKLQKSLEAIDAKIAGVVINKMDISMKTYNSKYYYSESSNKKDNNNEQSLENVEIETVNEVIKRYNNKIKSIANIEEEKIYIAKTNNKEDVIQKESEIIEKIENKLNNLTLNITKEEIESKTEELKQYIQNYINQEKINNIEEEIYNIQNLIASSIIKNNNEEQYSNLEEKLEEILNKTEKETANKEEKFSKLEKEISSLKQEIIAIKELLENNEYNNLNTKKIVNIRELKENRNNEIKKNKIYLNKKDDEEDVYDIYQELRSEDLSKPINQFSQILKPSKTGNIAN